MGSCDSVHRNIAEGYGRRSVREYIQHLYIALGSLAETVSGFRACKDAGQLKESDFESLDQSAYRLENGLLRLVEALEAKAERGEWTDRMIIRESNAAYRAETITKP